MRKLPVLALLLGTTLTGAWAQTNWPAALADNELVASRSARAAKFPADVKLAPQATGARATWSGGWRGWACGGFQCDIGLVVEDIRGDQATVVFALGAAEREISERLTARFVGEELQARLADGTTIHFRPRPDRNIDFLWQRPADWVGGVLAKDDSSAQQRQAAAQRWLANDAIDVRFVQPWQTYTIVLRPRRGSTDFLGDAGDGYCLTARVPTRFDYAEPYMLVEFVPQLNGCNYRVQYRVHPVTGRGWAFRSDDDGRSWRHTTGKAQIQLER